VERREALDHRDAHGSLETRRFDAAGCCLAHRRRSRRLAIFRTIAQRGGGRFCQDFSPLNRAFFETANVSSSQHLVGN